MPVTSSSVNFQIPAFNVALEGPQGPPGPPGSNSWTDITGKPATFPPDPHTHTSAEVIDFSEAVDDRVGTLLTPGTNVTLNYNDAANTLTINAAGGIPDWGDITNKPSTFPPDPEAVDDRVSSLLVPGTNVTLNYNDAANTLTINSAGGGTATSVTFTPAGNIAATNVQAALVELDTEKVGKAGDTMTGLLVLSADPAVALGAATKQYVDAKASVIVSDTPPVGAPDKTLWWESDSGLLYLRYNDGTSTQWVIASPQPDISTFLTTSPQTFTAAQQQQMRQNVYAAPFDAMAYSGMQINGGMEVSQELGTTGRGTSGYVCDGWYWINSATAVAYAGVAFTSINPGLPGYFNVSVSTAQATLTTTQGVSVVQFIEGYRTSRLAWGTASAQPITINFWTCHNRTGVYSVKVGNAADTRTYVTTYTQNVADTWEYKTVTVPGDTTGTWNKNNTVGMTLQFAMACGPTYTASVANVWSTTFYVAAPGQVNGVAATSDYFRMGGVTVLPGNEAPSAARSPYIMRPYDQELATCKRYYQKYSPAVVTYVTNATYPSPGSILLPVVMRTVPTIVGGFTVNGGSAGTFATPGNLPAGVVNTIDNISFFNSASNWTGGAVLNVSITADARL